MSAGWAPRRFWTEATAQAAAGGWGVVLDGRAVRTPAKALLVVPTPALAEAIAAEWAAQGAVVVPATMPLTRTANSAIDTVAAHHAAVARDLARYAETDLLCHRAAAPAGLAARQAAGWDPWLAWAAGLGAPLRVTAGVLAVPQPGESLARLAARVAARDAFALAGLHETVTLTGSLILGLAVAEGVLAADRAFALSRIDEDWQAELWGEDAEAAAAAAARARAMADAGRFLALLQGHPAA